MVLREELQREQDVAADSFCVHDPAGCPKLTEFVTRTVSIGTNGQPAV